ncbi:MAG TPA: hypothetical protein VKT78_14345, partial [Fimbriimonadaceae bacterium]|nr:hypothetical protein [Fimbriimonadaceae bacterium]
MHRLYGAIRFVLVLAPALLLAAWGLSYVRACWNVVLAPGVPVRLEWKTPGGNLKFTAASYSFNPRSGFLAVNRPELKDPEGRRLAAANLADVTGIDLVDITQSGLHIHLFGASGTLVRDPDGRFELQEFLGGPKSKARPVPFDVAIDRADVLLIDRKGGSEWTRTASFRDINVAGIGPHWVAGGDVELENAGSGRISVSHLASGDLALRTVASNWTLADLGRHLLSTLPPDRTRSVEPIEASTVTLSGPVEVMVPAKGEPEVRFDGSLDATGVRLRGYAASNLKFAGRVTAGGAAGAVTASAPGESAQLTGWVDWRNGRVTCSGS